MGGSVGGMLTCIGLAHLRDATLLVESEEICFFQSSQKSGGFGGVRGESISAMSLFPISVEV